MKQQQRAQHEAAALENMSLLTIPAAAGRLGSSDMHVYRLIANGVLRAVDIAQPGARKSKTRVRSDDLNAYIEANTRTAPAGDAA
jgi:excisionase family DNA binding protein